MIKGRNVGLLAAMIVLTSCTTSVEGSGSGGEAIRYEASFPNREHHEAEVSVTFSDLSSAPLELRMSRTSPGRYALHEFAKNVYNVRIVDASGNEANVHRPDPHQWTVSDHGGTVTVSYTLFGDRADGTYAAIDETHAHMNMPATFMWARGLGERPIELTVHAPEETGWSVATQLEPTDDPFTFKSPNLAYFLDSPTMVGPLDWREWPVPGPEGVSQTVRIAIHHDGDMGDVDRYEAQVRRIVDEIAHIFGEFPAFDYGTYTFLVDYLPWASGDGMEHRNSTVLSSTASISGNQTGVLGTVAHEFIHAWNIERIRPADIEPFDFEEADMSRALWFGEGFTSYLDDVALVRAEVIDFEAFAARMGGAINSVTNSPGRSFFSPVEMSMQAPFVDAAVSVDPQNRGNTFISYYTWGSVVGLGLDLTLRTQFANLSIDDYMQAVWAAHGRQEQSYEVVDLERVLGELTTDTDFASDFFARYVNGSEVPDFTPMLAEFGVRLELARPDTPFIGFVPGAAGNGGLQVSSSTQLGTPIYEAGLNRGDLLVSIAGLAVGSPARLREVTAGLTVGDTVSITWVSRGAERTGQLVVAADPALRAVLVEADGQPISSEVEARRLEWANARGTWD